jgi:hypothetical protein
MNGIRPCYCGAEVELRRQGINRLGEPWGWAIYCPRCEVEWLTIGDGLASIIEMWDEEEREPWCCLDWQKAQQEGTDHEGWGAFVLWFPLSAAEPQYWKGGCGLSPINFCPWCGVKKP